MKNIIVSLFTIVLLGGPLAGNAFVPQLDRAENIPQPDVSMFEPFTLMSLVTPADLVVPTVVEVPLTTHIERSTFAVYERETGSFIPYRYEVAVVERAVAMTLQTNGSGSAQNLTDKNYDTSVHFALPTEGEGVAGVVFRGASAVTSSGLVLSLAANVARPTYVALYATDAQGVESTVVAKTRLAGNTIRFPETTAQLWRLELTHAQPLRLTEVALLQDNVEKSTQRSLRFLAQPLHTYALYLNPDRSVRIPTSEAGNLISDEDVLLLPTSAVFDNPDYVVADSDEDGVADIADNCVSVANTDQIDIDGNGRGDVCDDYDRDGRINSLDNCPDQPNRQQQDEDGDGVGDECDDEESRITEKYAWIPWVGLGFAALVIITMFAVVMRRPEEEVVSAESEPPAQPPTV